MKRIILLLLLLAVLWGCDKAGPVYHYREITFEPASEDPHAGLDLAAMKLPAQQQTNDPALAQMLQDSVVKAPIAWDVPAGWKASPGEGMRLVTFNSTGEDPITCTIVSLGGIAGGLEENVGRWARQINVDLDAESLTEFVATAQTINLPSGLVVSVVDFTSFQQDAAADSMVAAILTLEDISTIFIKMTGTKAAVLKNKEAFLKLCQSLRLEHE